MPGASSAVNVAQKFLVAADVSRHSQRQRWRHRIRLHALRAFEEAHLRRLLQNSEQEMISKLQNICIVLRASP
jgi:hypothetical protein